MQFPIENLCWNVSLNEKQNATLRSHLTISFDAHDDAKQHEKIVPKHFSNARL